MFVIILFRHQQLFHQNQLLIDDCFPHAGHGCQHLYQPICVHHMTGIGIMNFEA